MEGFLFIPDHVSKLNISDSAKMMYGLILQSAEDGVCQKDDMYFSSQLNNVSNRTLERYKKELINANLIALINFKNIKKAIFVVNKDDLKNEDYANQDILASVFDKFVKNQDKSVQNNTDNNPILNILVNLINLVLVSYKYKNININKNTHARETAFEDDNTNKFRTYQRAGTPTRVREFSGNDRRDYTNTLFKEYFDYYDSGNFYNSALEVVDNMIEAYNEAETERGFIFDGKKYTKSLLNDIYLNITDSEFQSIVAQVTTKVDIKTRSPYIMGAIMQAGKKISWKKTDELVRKGFPWNVYTPESKLLSNIVFKAQQRIEREQRFLKYKKELGVNSC